MTTTSTTAPSAGTGVSAPVADLRSSWLVRLRWGSVAGQVLIILAASRLARLDLPLPTLFGLAAAMAATNAALHLFLRGGPRALPPALSGGILAFDMVQLTALLYVTGGAANPFSVFYLVQITAAATLLGSAWTWLLTGLGVSAYAVLFALPQPAADAAHAAHDFASHLRTMWVALTVAAGLTAFFVTRLTSGVAERDRQILAMRESAARRERLSALTTLAAGAAHELATPLTTVAVVAGELERGLSSLDAEDRARFEEDVRLIRAEVVRCRDILDELAVGAGSAAGEMPTRFGTRDLVEDVLVRLHPEAASRVAATASGSEALFLPRRALARVVLSLVRNALDASPADGRVSVDVETRSGLQVRVKDQGTGMSADVIARAGEPFFTTKAPGQGLGLGLYLAHSLARQLGGALSLESGAGRGTTATLRLPLHVNDAKPA